MTWCKIQSNIGTSDCQTSKKLRTCRSFPVEEFNMSKECLVASLSRNYFCQRTRLEEHCTQP